MKNQRGFAALEAVLIVIIIAMLGGVIWYVVKQNKDTGQTGSSSSSAMEQSTEKYKPTFSVPDGWKTYENQEYKISFAYPHDWKVDTKTKEPGQENSYSASELINFSINSRGVFLSTSGEPIDASITVLDQPAEQIIEKLKKDYDETYEEQIKLGGGYGENLPRVFTSKEIIFQGKKGFEVIQGEFNNNFVIYYFVEHNGHTFWMPGFDPEIATTQDEDPTNPTYTARTIIDSVKFL
jgi:hypothetical protein